FVAKWRVLASSKRTFLSDLIGIDVFRWKKKKDDLAELRALEHIQSKPQTIKVAVTGASGNIGYALLFHLASGEMFEKNQRVQINSNDLSSMVPKVNRVAMELYMIVVFPNLEGILIIDSLERGDTEDAKWQDVQLGGFLNEAYEAQNLKIARNLLATTAFSVNQSRHYSGLQKLEDDEQQESEEEETTVIIEESRQITITSEQFNKALTISIGIVEEIENGFGIISCRYFVCFFLLIHLKHQSKKKKQRFFLYLYL
ncbi:malate dehydrogenase, partial [Reticulomyxa filosa]